MPTPPGHLSIKLPPDVAELLNRCVRDTSQSEADFVIEGIRQICGKQEPRNRDKKRRITVQRYHELKDREEDFDEAKAAATDPIERQRMMDELAAFRRAHREEDVSRGRRPEGGGAMLQLIMWKRWIEIAVEHELSARRAHMNVRAGDDNQRLDELRTSMVATAAATSALEALVEELDYLLVPALPRKGTTAGTSVDILTTALGLDVKKLADDLGWLFETRNKAVHPYFELDEPQPHPAGPHTDAAAAIFNAYGCRRAVDIAIGVLESAASPHRASGRWVARWATERDPIAVAKPLKDERDAAQLPEPEETDRV